MFTDDDHEDRTDAVSRVLVGLVLLPLPLGCLLVPVFVFHLGGVTPETVTTAVVCAFVGFLSGRLVYRLVTGRRRKDGGLMGPGAIVAGGALISLGAAGLVAMGVAKQAWGVVLMGVVGLPAVVGAWRLAKARR